MFYSALSPEPLLAHSYERVMPGREYVASIRDFWRVCSGINEPTKEKVVKFLSEILNDEKIKRYFELGCEVKGLGCGHVKRIKDKVRLSDH